MKNNIGLEVRANGKVNLYLDVLSRADDGFHSIKSIMQSVSLCDRMIVSAARSSKTEIRICCDVPYVPCDERNIAHKAAAKFLEKCGIQAEVDISLHKRIPVSGGMAGGSTDAAGTLRALNKLFGGAMPNDELYKIAASLGSDIPFCLMGKTALCEGRGEILTPLENRAKLLFLIVPSSESVSTPWAYGELDRIFGDFSGRDNEARFNALCTALASGDVHGVCDNMYNIFEDAILPERPIARRAKELLKENGAIGAMMSGSGPTVFGIFESEETRASAAAVLKENGYYPKTAESII
ncbi:MAG: 4-(cytidine 5'-diphospho)-2-C-methyl-D-erythritol kinase [Ruminococcaceae bacterium]|nr:4-(cytidine 5'-diphospho)-2-C-methyl-D-erythritol kinase [Oscillospiraceae bacterium]